MSMCSWAVMPSTCSSTHRTQLYPLQHVNFDSLNKLLFMSFLVIFTWVDLVQIKMAKTRQNAYICVLINFLQGLPRTKNVHLVFGPKPALWADEHVLMSSYEHVLIRSWRMSWWACAHAWAVLSMCSCARRTKLFPTWFWKFNKIYT
jgi:hypothetical protein